MKFYYKYFVILIIFILTAGNGVSSQNYLISSKHNFSQGDIIKPEKEKIMDIKELRKNKLIDIFCTLAEIPSPSGQEDKVAQKIIEILKQADIEAKQDDFGNVKAKIPATDSAKKPLLLSAHMDVIGDNSPINIKYNGQYIETDKKRTLGADDKAGVAAAINLAIEIKKNQNLKHGGLELVFTKDEEQGLSGINHIDFSDLESEYVLVLDADKLGQILVAGASYTNAVLDVTAPKGGHSGIDIADKERVNAVKLIGELINEIPQGVYKANELGVVTSINIGSVIGGGVEPCIKQISDENIKAESYIDYIAEKSMTNLINTHAKARYSIRSSELANEKELIEKIQKITENFNKKYEGLAKAEFIATPHLPAFERSNDHKLEELGAKACKAAGAEPSVTSFHAGAETHIYAHKKNKSGKTFKPYLIGCADVYNMHSSDEKINVESYLKGYEFLKKFFEMYNVNENR